ncbi:MAG: hypothetical protein P4M15_13200 [Alphaproteobacteria bacterium]|nr:hypothetical protein [Alphaproteobacteria bacterium]
MSDMQNELNEMSALDALEFVELEARFGEDNARAILRTLEQFEGISEIRVAKLSYADRMRNVMAAMKDNIRFQTRH